MVDVHELWLRYFYVQDIHQFENRPYTYTEQSKWLLHLETSFTRRSSPRVYN
jgi:hypothetical protein